MRENDARYDGRFYVGVLSTRIYCLPSCKAKTPLLKNVRFFASREEAVAAGLRGCRRCRSEKFPDVLPDWLHRVLACMRKNRSERLNEMMLEEATGVAISTVRRYFKKHHNITPLAFHRRLRLNEAQAMILSGSDYLEAAFDTGWESASGFREAYKREFGCTPGENYVRQ